MVKMKFSASNASFYDSASEAYHKKSGDWPEDLVDVDEKNYAKFCENPPPGKTRGTNDKGYPAWVDAPKPTPEEARYIAELNQRQRMDDAARIIAPLQDSVDLDMATESEKSALLAWKKYRVLLNSVDISTAPDIDWPEPPDAEKTGD